jgi:hypothetical protein
MARKLIDNERRACDAVVRALEAHGGIKRAGAYSPEDEKIGPPVEYVFELRAQKHAVEHTVIEAFPGQIRANTDFASFVSPIEAALHGNLPPPGKFDLIFDIDPTQGLTAKMIAKAQAGITLWVAKNALDLHAEQPTQPDRRQSLRGYQNERKDIVEGVRIHLIRETGWWMPEPAKGRLFITRFAPPNYETLRLNRIKTAMKKKLPKLEKWKADGTRTILVLENRDMALSNHGEIYDAVESALAGQAYVPDEVWLVDTTIDNEWTAWCLLRDGQGFPDEDTEVRYRDFNPNELTDL